MSMFSGRHYPREDILWAVRWYCRYGISYRDHRLWPAAVHAALIQ